MKNEGKYYPNEKMANFLVVFVGVILAILISLQISDRDLQQEFGQRIATLEAKVEILLNKKGPEGP